MRSINFVFVLALVAACGGYDHTTGNDTDTLGTAGADADTDADADSDADSDTDADTDADADADADSDSDSDSDADADGDADSDPDPDDEEDEDDKVILDQYGDVVAEYDSCSQVDWEELCEDLGGACAWQEFAANAEEVWYHWENVQNLESEAPDNWTGWTDGDHLEGEDAERTCGAVYLGCDAAIRGNNTSCPDEDSFDEEPWGQDAMDAGCSWLAMNQTDDDATLTRAFGAICSDGDEARSQADAWCWDGEHAGCGSHGIAVCDDSFDLDDLDNE